MCRTVASAYIPCICIPIAFATLQKANLNLNTCALIFYYIIGESKHTANVLPNDFYTVGKLPKRIHVFTEIQMELRMFFKHSRIHLYKTPAPI